MPKICHIFNSGQFLPISLHKYVLFVVFSSLFKLERQTNHESCIFPCSFPCNLPDVNLPSSHLTNLSHQMTFFRILCLTFLVHWNSQCLELCRWEHFDLLYKRKKREIKKLNMTITSKSNWRILIYYVADNVENVICNVKLLILNLRYFFVGSIWRQVLVWFFSFCISLINYSDFLASVKIDGTDDQDGGFW